jgi:hypothetical protein
MSQRRVHQESNTDSMVIASSQETRPGRRTERRDVETVVSQSAVRQSIDIRRSNRRAEATELGKSRVIQQDHHHVRTASTRLLVHVRTPGQTPSDLIRTVALGR